MFNHLPAFAPPKPRDAKSELIQYLAADVKHVKDPIEWWYDHCATYPQLSHMAIDYLTIPGKSFQPNSNLITHLFVCSYIC